MLRGLGASSAHEKWILVPPVHFALLPVHVQSQEGGATPRGLRPSSEREKHVSVSPQFVVRFA